jgi:hypothetical protein
MYPLVVTTNNQPSMGVGRPEKDNPTQQAGDEDLVGRVGKLLLLRWQREQQQRRLTPWFLSWCMV